MSDRAIGEAARVSDVLRGAPELGELPPSAVAVLCVVEQLVARTVAERGPLATLGDYVAAVVVELAPVVAVLDREEGGRV